MPTDQAPSLEDAVPPYIDTANPSIARVYDAALNGKDNYEVDRALLHRIEQVAPESLQIARDNRDFLIRACRFIAHETDITQFLDCGSGLPTAENTHQVVQRIQPDARVVYVDNDPVVVAHGRALLEENDQTHFVAADIFKPGEILKNEIVRKYIDFTQPIALIQNATMHHYEGDRSPGDLMGEYIEAIPPGSYVVLSHFFDPETPEESALARRIEDILLHSPLNCGWFRTRSEVESMLPGLELVEPGLVQCVDWWPSGPRIKPLTTSQHCIAGAVGRKP